MMVRRVNEAGLQKERETFRRAFRRVFYKEPSRARIKQDICWFRKTVKETTELLGGKDCCSIGGLDSCRNETRTIHV